jgi:hypothetical protein
MEAAWITMADDCGHDPISPRLIQRIEKRVSEDDDAMEDRLWGAGRAFVPGGVAVWEFRAMLEQKAAFRSRRGVEEAQ